MRLDTSKSKIARAPLVRMIPVIVLLALVFSSVQPTAVKNTALAQTAGTPATSAASWNTYFVDDPSTFFDMSSRSLRFDASGNPRVAYGGDHLYFAWFDSTSAMWYRVVVDSAPQVGAYASLALNSSGNPFISYYDAAGLRLKFAYTLASPANWSNPGVWNIQVVDTPTTQANSGAISTPKKDLLESFIDGRLHSIKDDRAAPQELESGQAVNLTYGLGLYTSIAVDKLGYVHISYYDAEHQALKYAKWNGASPWQIRIADGPPANGSDPQYNVGRYSSIAVGSDNLARISYMNEKYDCLKYWVDNTFPGGDVICFNSFDQIHYGAFTSLVLDSSNNPYVSHLAWETDGGNVSRTGLAYSKIDGNGDWETTIVDNSGLPGWYSSIGLTSGGTPLISYYDAQSGDLRYAAPGGKGWSVSILLSEGDVGYFTSLAVDPSNYPGITFYNASNGQFQFLRLTSSGWTGGVIDTAGDVGRNSSLALKGDYPWITYFDDTNDQLKLAIGQAFVWWKYLLYNGASFSSLKLSATGEPRFAFYDSANGYLRYAYMQNGTWYVQLVDSTANVGQYPSLALDNNGQPQISYYDATNQRLKYAFWNGSAWVVEVVDESASVGMYNSLTISRSSMQCFVPGNFNCPMISYYDATNGRLLFAFKSSTNAWVPLVVDQSANVGLDTSMALGSDGALRVSYYDATNGNLKLATGYQTATGWVWPTILVGDSANNVGLYTSLAVDASNNVHISYYDATFGDLRYALYSGGVWSFDIVDSAGNVGKATSLALNASGQPGISYFDEANFALKFASVFPLPSRYLAFFSIVRR